MNIEELRLLCLSMPGATEGLKWEDHICFMVADKIFCMMGGNGNICFKVTPEEFAELIERDGIVPTPYMARNKWVTIIEFSGLKTSEWEHYIRQSYTIIVSKLTRKLRENLTL